MVDALLSALVQVLSPYALAMMLVGVLIGFVVGILPGLGGAVTLALLLPFTFNMDPIPAFSLLLGMYIVASTAGDITAVLFGVPGEASSAAVVLDGYPMTRKGQAGRALGAVLTASAGGAIFGAVVIVLAVPVIRPLILAIGPPELFGLALLGLTFVITLSSRQLRKGGLVCLLGILIAMVGLDPSTGAPRYTFGSLELWEGISIVPVVIGLFGGAEVLQIMLKRGSLAVSSGDTAVVGVGRGIREALQKWQLVLRSSAIATSLSTVPGMGGSVAQFIAYGHAKQISKKPDEFGKGSADGVISAGSTGVAKDCGSLLPTLAFGIPGSASSAVLLSAFLILGLNPGKEMLTTNLDVTMSFVWIALFATAASIALGFLLAKPLTKLTQISGPLLVPFLILLLAIGSYSASNSMLNVLLMLIFVAIGVACLRWDWPRVPLLLGFVLGGVLERYLFLSNSVFGASWLYRPFFLVILVGIVGILGSHARRLHRARRAAAAPAGKESVSS